MTINDAKRLAEQGLFSDAIDLLTSIITENPENADAFFERGKLYWRTGNRSAATTDYAHSASLQPDGQAARALEMARDIESYFNPDLLNP